ncbi:MAG: hypothetical protein NVSMB9_23310 [Isosphaeraceae bacterium]
MIELLALPAWNLPETPLSSWIDQLVRQGLAPLVNRESSSLSWIEVHALRLRGYALTKGGNVEAINFELAAVDSECARRALEEAASALSWELHEDEDDETDDDE